jgi:hypothetical protein
VSGRRAADSAKMPPPQPMSRYLYFFGVAAVVGDGWGASEARQALIKSWRRGFMRCKRREEPWGSHHVEARALKCDTSVGLTEEVGLGVEEVDEEVL